jgi:methionyl-tRNA synthetase
MGGDKMSKSKGNVVDPIALIDEFGADALRYFLLREISFGTDGNFSREALISRINSDLANDLGNLIYRTSAMLQRYFGGHVPAPGDPDEVDRSLANLSMETVNRYREQMDVYDMNAALESIWKLVGRANKYIDEKAPWNLAKHEEDQPRLARVMYNLVEVIRMVDLMIFPFIPATGRKIWAQLSLPGEIEAVGLAACSWGRLPVGVEVKHEEPLFPRIEIKEETPANPPAQQEKPQAPKAQAAQTPVSQPSAAKGEEEGAGLISIDDFGKVDLRVGTIRQAERIQGADKLLKLKVDLGEGRERQIVAGIALYYSPEDLPGRQVVWKPGVAEEQE